MFYRFVFYFDGTVLKKGTKLRKIRIKNEKVTKQEINKRRKNEAGKSLNFLKENDPNTQIYIRR